MRTNLFLGAAAVALIAPAAAMAQSTGTVDAETRDVVVTGARGDRAPGGIQQPDTPKARGVLTQEFIARQVPGQSVDDIINQLPGVSFQNNDPFGSAGGTLTIRGFDSSRISQTFDGIPLNDTGNYAIYSNQQLDPELIEQVNVNLGTTDVDSPTASATGSTVNYRSLMPTDDFGVRMVGSVGDYSFMRVFGLVNTGVFTSFGTKAWFSASKADNDVVFTTRGKIDKQQFNAKVYQPIGGNGDFIAVSGNYNENRNNFFGSAPLRRDTVVLNANSSVFGARTVGTNSNNRFPASRDELPYSVPYCQTAAGTAGRADAPNACGVTYDERYNPSNTGNIRVNSKFTITDHLTFTADPYFEYTKANGGGTTSSIGATGAVTGNLREGSYTRAASATQAAITTPLYGYIGGGYYIGQDANGDGDLLDRVTELAPSETVTHRYGVIASLRYDFSPEQSVRVGYTHDYGRHRQTGEVAGLQPNGFPDYLFPQDGPLILPNGFALQKRDRLSYAVLDQASGEYRGQFFDRALTVTLGVRAPFLKRNLNQFCFTTAANGNVDCFGRGETTFTGIYAAANPYGYNATTNTVTGYAAPQSRQYTYNRVLPNLGATYKFDRFSVYASYSKGFQVPGTDNLYQAFYYPQAAAAANPTPETSDNFDAGLRYSSGKIQAFVGPWYTRFQNRLASAFDPDTQQTFYRNLGRVDKYGVDGSVNFQPVRGAMVYAFGSYLKSEIKNNVQIGNCTTITTANCTAVGQPIYALTAGKRESGAPVWTAGGRLQYTFGPLTIGGQGKHTGRRYLNDQNLPELQCTGSTVNAVCPTTSLSYQTYGAFAKGYTTFDFDVRLALDFAGVHNQKTYLQFNVVNAFDRFYVGGFSGGSTTQYNVPFSQIGSPRAFIGTINVGF
jgi:iron complex outermembrane receptor protein